MKRTFASALIIAVLAAAGAQSVAADDFHRGWRGPGPGFPYHGPEHWNNGHWYHGWHGDRLGWWWVLAGTWYLYPGPVYPYPRDRPVVILEDASPPTVVVQQGSSGASAPPAPPPPSAQSTPSWYYCESPKGYYPYVSSCPGGWKTVPATPPDLPRQ